MSNSEVTPKIYVGTYHKYNSGSLKGEWIELDQFDEWEEFMEYCEQLHSDESDPELMFQDWEGIPEPFISESSLKEDFFYWQERMEELSSEEQEAFYIYCDNYGYSLEDVDYVIDQFQDAYQGYWGDSLRPKRDFTYDLVDDLGYIDQLPKHLRLYFDYEAFQRDLFISDYWEREGHIFRNV